MTKISLEQRIARLERKIDVLLQAKKTESEEKDWVSEAEASKIVKWGGQYLRQQAKKGKIAVRYKNVRGRNWKFYAPDLKRLIN